MSTPSLLGSHRPGCYKPSRAKQPSGEHDGSWKPPRLSGENDEYRLANLFSQVSVAHLAHRCGIDKVEVTLDQQVERALRMILRVCLE